MQTPEERAQEIADVLMEPGNSHLDVLSPGFHELIAGHIRQAVREVQLRAAETGGWLWMGDGHDDLGSMADQMEVRITAGQLRRLLPAEDLRAAGWSVAVHNDYLLNGERWTFWGFSKGREWVRGEGRTDKEALDQVRAELKRRRREAI